MDDRCYTADYCLYLGDNVIRVDPHSQITSIFFDDANQQIFAVRSGGTTGVVVKSPEDSNCHAFRMEDKGPLTCIKFSPDQTVLAVQRTTSFVEFFNYSNGTLQTPNYSQSARKKNSEIIGFAWCSANEILLISKSSIDLYQVIKSRMILKFLKSHTLSINWFLYHEPSKLLLAASGSSSNLMFPFQVKPSNISRFPKFEIDIKSSNALKERDVCIGQIYGLTRIIVMVHKCPTDNLSSTDIDLYTLCKDGVIKKSHCLKVGITDKLAINIVDNLIVVHQQSSKGSLIFDINLESEFEGTVSLHRPVTNSLTIKPFKLKVTTVPTKAIADCSEIVCEHYASSWVIFQPDIVIDVKLGCLWYLKLELESFINQFDDRVKLMAFLLSRQESKAVIIKVLNLLICDPQYQNIFSISKSIDLINNVYRSHLNVAIQSQTALPVGGQSPPPIDDIFQVLIDQSDMYTNVLVNLYGEPKIQFNFKVSIVMEYIRSLISHKIPVQHFVYELLINLLVRNDSFYQLHQLLQYCVVSDSKPLACLLLSLKNSYNPAYQLALDMLKRLGTADEEIIEILLSRSMVINALRFVRSSGKVDFISARKFLEASVNDSNPSVFYSVFKFFEQRNLRMKGTSVFGKGEHCEVYVEKFMEMFGSKYLHPDIQAQLLSEHNIKSIN